jgi:hypothetical protein
MYDEEELTCQECGAKLTGEEGMTICLPCQDGDDEVQSDDFDGSELHGSLIV